MQRINYQDLQTTDLLVDAVYESNGATNLSGDVLSKLMGVGAMGGIRKRQTDDKKRLAYVVLESTNKHADWLDYVDYEYKDGKNNCN